MTKQPISFANLITKGEAKASTPTPEPAAAPAPAETSELRKPRKEPYYKSLTLKVNFEQYMAVRRICFEREASAQELLTEALEEWLKKNGTP